MGDTPTGVLLRVRSHRARDRLRRITTDTVEWFSFMEEAHYTEVPAEHVEAALAIPSINRARRPRSPIHKCWGQ